VYQKRGSTQLVYHSARRGTYIGIRALLVKNNLYELSISLAYPSGEEKGLYMERLSAFAAPRRGGRGSQHPMSEPLPFAPTILTQTYCGIFCRVTNMNFFQHFMS
jgi:hypothetical protein